MILERPNFISDEFVEEIRLAVDPFVQRSDCKEWYNREGITVFLSNEDKLKELDAKVCSVFSKAYNDILVPKFRPARASADTGYEYHLYKPNNICKQHADYEFTTFNTPSALLRYATVILFLTTNTGGELVFPEQGVEVAPEKGKLVVFPPYGFYQHYTRPALEDREILMTWFVYNDVTVIKNAA